MCFNSDLNAGHLPGVCHQPCESLFGCPGSAGVFPGTLLSASSWQGRVFSSCCHRVRRSKNNFSWCFHTWCLCYRAIWLLQSLCVRLLSKTVLRQTSCSTWKLPTVPSAGTVLSTVSSFALPWHPGGLGFCVRWEMPSPMDRLQNELTRVLFWETGSFFGFCARAKIGAGIQEGRRGTASARVSESQHC